MPLKCKMTAQHRLYTMWMYQQCEQDACPYEAYSAMADDERRHDENVRALVEAEMRLSPALEGPQ